LFIHDFTLYFSLKLGYLHNIYTKYTFFPEKSTKKYNKNPSFLTGHITGYPLVMSLGFHRNIAGNSVFYNIDM